MENNLLKRLVLRSATLMEILQQYLRSSENTSYNLYSSTLLNILNESKLSLNALGHVITTPLDKWF